MNAQSDPLKLELDERRSSEPLRMCIAALGGEGGNVLTNWIVTLACEEGWPAQSTSIPGVAQRTGATTYYIEMWPWQWDDPQEPIFALTPTPGFVDIVVATELLEAGRVIEQGLVSPDRTTLITSAHRAYTIEERSAMADGRIPSGQLLKAAMEAGKRTLLLDLATLAANTGAIVSSVVFGALAASGIVPAGRDRFEAVLRSSGIAVDANLRGFAAGYDAVTGHAAAPQEVLPPGKPEFAAEVEEIVRLGVERLTEYQDAAYAEHYRGLVRRIENAESARRRPGEPWRVTPAAARYLALMMSYEDIIRVAALKTKRQRWERILAAPGDNEVVKVTEFLKPGIEEFASILPPALGRRLVNWAQRTGRLERYHIGLGVRTTSVTGFMIMRFLASLRPWRRRSYRFGEEMAAIEDWIGQVEAATRIDPEFGAEVAECARIRKGYGATHRRGAANFRAILDYAVRPAIAAGTSEAALVARLRQVALSDPEGNSLQQAVAALQSQELPDAR